MGMHGKEFPDFLAHTCGDRAHGSIGPRTNSNSPFSAPNMFGAYPKDLYKQNLSSVRAVIMAPAGRVFEKLSFKSKKGATS